MKTVWLLLAVFMAGCHGQLHLENDYGAFFNKNNDQNFTHGTKLSYYDDDEVAETRATYSLGQSIYTPRHKRTDSLPSDLADDRSYTGWLYGEYRSARIVDRVRSVWGIQAGCTGRCSYAKETQRGVHSLLGQNYPTWDRNYSLKSEPGFILEKENYYEIFNTLHAYADHYALLKVGNIIDSVSYGSSFKYGVHIDRFGPEPITFKLPKEESPWSYYLFGNAEVRGVGYNHFLDGSLFQHERHTVDASPLVGEANLGIRFGYKKVKLSYNYSAVSEEWDGQNGAFFYGGIDASW